MIEQESLHRATGTPGHAFGEAQCPIPRIKRWPLTIDSRPLDTRARRLIQHRRDQWFKWWVVLKQDAPRTIDAPRQHIEAMHRQTGEESVRR